MRGLIPQLFSTSSRSALRESDQKPNQPPQDGSRRSMGPPRSAVFERPADRLITPTKPPQKLLSVKLPLTLAPFWYASPPKL